jgi:hypothetical protein
METSQTPKIPAYTVAIVLAILLALSVVTHAIPSIPW